MFFKLSFGVLYVNIAAILKHWQSLRQFFNCDNKNTILFSNNFTYKRKLTLILRYKSKFKIHIARQRRLTAYGRIDTQRINSIMGNIKSYKELQLEHHRTRFCLNTRSWPSQLARTSKQERPLNYHQLCNLNLARISHVNTVLVTN
jgi:hypothetical protein